MDDDRQTSLCSQAKLGDEGLFLNFGRDRLPMVIKADLTDRHDFGMVAQSTQFFQRLRRKIVAAIGMDADSRIDARMRFGQSNSLSGMLQVDTRFDDEIDALRTGLSDDRRTICIKLFQIQMAVAIDQMYLLTGTPHFTGHNLCIDRAKLALTDLFILSQMQK